MGAVALPGTSASGTNAIMRAARRRLSSSACRSYRRPVEGVALVCLPHLEDGGPVLSEGHHTALVGAVAAETVQLLGLSRAPSGLLEDLVHGRRRGGR